MDRGTWQATIHGVAKSQTQVKQLGTHARMQHSFSLHFQSALLKRTAPCKSEAARCPWTPNPTQLCERASLEGSGAPPC